MSDTNGGRWCQSLEEYDLSESLCPERDSAQYFFKAIYDGKQPEPRVFYGDGSVLVRVPGTRPVRFVMRRLILTTQLTETRFERHV